MQQQPQHTPGPYEAEESAGQGAWVRGSDGKWIALVLGDTEAVALANKELVVNALNAHNPQHRVIEAADTLNGKAALTITWADGEETVEVVSHRAAALLGYTPDGEAE